MEILKSLFLKLRSSGAVSVTLLPQSGSNRKYYRMQGSDGFSCIAVIGVDVNENRTFCKLSACLESVGVNVPKLLIATDDYERYLQTDLGSDDLNSIMKADRECGIFTPQHEALLKKTLAMLPKIQFEGGAAWDFGLCYPSRKMNERKLMFDLNYFKYCFLKPMGVEFNEEKLQDEFERLCADILSDPSQQLFLYRDFQSRNVMVKDGEPYFIDFQGGMEGPFYYDLASFVFQFADRYPSQLRESLVAEYYSALRKYIDIDEACFRRRLNLYVLLRHLQVLGCYGFRGLIEGKQLFIDCIPDGFRGLAIILNEPLDGYPYLYHCLAALYEAGCRRFNLV